MSEVDSAGTTYTLQPSATKVTGGSFAALDPATGAIRWQTADPQGAGDYGFVSTAAGVVSAGSSEGVGKSMYALDTTTGSILWSYASGSSVMGGAAVVNGMVYWASGYHDIVCPGGQSGCGKKYSLDAFGL